MEPLERVGTEITPLSIDGHQKQLRTLFVLGEVPYPATGGAALRNRQNIEALRRYGPVHLICLELRNKKADVASDSPPFTSIFRTPEARLPDPVDLALRALSLLFGEKLRSAAKQRRRQRKRRRRTKHEQSVARLVFEEISEFRADLVVVEEPRWMPYMPELRSHPVRVVYDAHNVEAILCNDLVRFNPHSRNRAAERTAQTKSAEKALVGAADQVWLCSGDDRTLFAQIYGTDVDTQVVPNGVDVDYYAGNTDYAGGGATMENSAKGPVLLFVGSYDYGPNVAAARYLVSEILPAVRKRLPDLRLVLCGRDPTSEMHAFAQADPDIEVTGKVNDVRPYFARADVMVVPLLHGGGTRLKILEAFAMGCPVVSTSKGAEGLAAVDGEHLLIAETAEALADNIVRCLSDPDLAGRLAAAGRGLVCEEYSWAANHRRIGAALESLLGRSDSEPADAAMAPCPTRLAGSG